ncbi:MAG: hypothetical protein HQ464_17625 [Planctomycetes bacterium]|nr:hypothetical protein [Planctomycetota bacterium]
MEPIARTIQLLATRITSEGFGDDSLDLLVIAHAARDLHVNEILVQVMVDDHEPEVARERAFAVVARTICAASDRHRTLEEPVERPLVTAC